MNHPNRILSWVISSVAGSALLFATLASAQTRSAAPVKPAAPSIAVASSVASEQDFASTQEQLIKLLRLSPTLTTVVSHDPSLLANQEYVSHNNPELAQFLTSHPEIARNPEFYLFTHLNGEAGKRSEALQRAVWPEMAQPDNQQYRGRPAAEEFISNMPPVLALACFLGALIWLIRSILENRRWGRVFNLQSEVHGKLIDKFSSNSELASYMDTEAGKRFLEAAPIAVGFEPEKRIPNAIARVLTPLQIGIVLVLLGVGCFFLRAAGADLNVPMLVFGTLALMPGIGFIISAGVTWVLAGRLGLMPENPKTPAGSREEQ
jgi:hypothetical protein